MIRAIEEYSMNAWPAIQTALYDGWILRFAQGYTRRANSISPLYPSRLELDEKVAFCEQIYRARGLRVIYKLTTAMEPAGLDEALAEKGYLWDAPTSVQTLELSEVWEQPDTPLSMSTSPTEPWLASYISLAGIAAQNQAALRQILMAILPDKCFASIQEGGETIACGLGVRQGPWMGLFDIVTAAPRRNQGYGKRLVAGLLAWGWKAGAGRAYLQVMGNNSPALSLYASLGFREHYQYWYRVKA